MLPPFDINEDVTVLGQSYENSLSNPELRTRIKVLDNGVVLVTASGVFEPMTLTPGQDIVVDVSMSAPSSAIVKYALYRITPKLKQCCTCGWEAKGKCPRCGG